MFNIKILKETPFDKKDTILSSEDFKRKYSYLVDPFSNDKVLKHNLNVDWFEIIDILGLSAKAEDWVWHEYEKKAYIVKDSYYTKFMPNYCSLDAVNQYPDIYKRFATKKEIEYFTLFEFCDNTILIGKYRCYYYHNVWKEVIGIQSNIKKYFSNDIYNKIEILKQDSHITDNHYVCVPYGLRVGCVIILDSDLMQIAKILS